MINREQILEMYHQGPEAVVSLVLGIVKAYGQRIQTMEKHIVKLESRSQKTPKTVISPP